MLRQLARRCRDVTGTWLRPLSSLEATPPQPPADLPPELLEWDYLIKQASSEEEKKEILELRDRFDELELLNKTEFKMTVDWDEFEGKVPDKILTVYKKIYADAEKAYNAGEFDLHFDEKEWEKQTGAFMQHVNTIVEEAKTRVDELEKEIQKTEGKLARLETATLEEELAADPEFAKKVDDAVSKELGYTP